MIEYANDTVIKLLKQYDMFSKTLSFTTDLVQKNDICNQMTKIITTVLEITNSIYEEKYLKISKRTVYLMDEEKTRLLEIINLINERRVYVNNQVITNKELTGIGIDVGTILGEERLEEYKSQVKIIERYKSNIKLESVLKEEIKNLDISIKKANDKINTNKKLNRQLEEKMIRIMEGAIEKLSLYELVDRSKEIDLAYTELGYSLEKAKENATIARRDCTEEIIMECDNMLSSITLEYERYKEKKLILKLINIFSIPVDNYDDLLEKREEINNIFMNITNSDLYKLVGNEISKQYATIKLELQDMSTLKSLTDEKSTKENQLKDIALENESEEFKGLLATLLENEKKYQEKLQEEKKKKEKEKKELEKKVELKRQEEMAKRQKALEEERKKEIEMRTKELLVEKKNPILNKNRTETIATSINKTKDTIEMRTKTSSSDNLMKRSQYTDEVLKRSKSDIEKRKTNDISTKSDNTNDFFSNPKSNSRITEKGIPVISNNNLENKVLEKKKVESSEKVFPDLKLEKKEDIFPSFPEMNNSSFFDDNEFNDLSNYLEDDHKKSSWF